MSLDTKKTESSSISPAWRGQVLGWLCLVVLIAFTWYPKSYFLMLAWPLIAIWLLGFLLLAAWAIWMLRQFKLPFKPLGYGLDWAIGLGVIALILSAIFSEFKQVAFWNVSIALGYWVLLYVLRNWLGKGGLTLQRLWIGLSLVGIITSIISLVSWLPQVKLGDGRNYLPLGHPNFMAGYTLLVLPLTLCLARYCKGWQRITLLAGSSVLAIVLYTTGSRGGYVGFLVSALVAIGFFIFQGRGKQRWLRLGVCTLLLTLILVITLNNSRVQRIVKVSPTANSPAVQLQVDGQTEDRLFMWKAGAKIFQTHPILGVGPGNMSRVYNLYRPLEVGTGGTTVQQLHSTYFQILGELGLIGFSACLLLLLFLSRLWLRLYRQLSEPKERCLLYGIGSGLLAYSASVLTDYQLENIGISSTIIFLIVLLIGLADISNLTPVKSMTNDSRRWLSLGGITTWVLVVFFWIPITWAVPISATSSFYFDRGNIKKAYEKSIAAANLVPWDPIYNFLVGFQAFRIKQNIQKEQDTELLNELRQISISYFRKGLDNAPYDEAFNQNLGMLYRDANDSKAQFYFSRAIQLAPRNYQYTYYLLGREYLKQQKIEKAIIAFALQGLINPEFVTLKFWNISPLDSVKGPVFQATINLYEELLKRLSSKNLYYNHVYEKLAILKWWGNQLISNLEQERLRPQVQALFIAEEAPDKAMKIIDDNLKNSVAREALLLLRAWLKPDRYLTDYFEQNSKDSVLLKNQSQLQNTIYQIRNIKDLLTSLSAEIQDIYRSALIFTYRNYLANKVAYVIRPKEIDNYFIVKLLDLFPSFPRTMPALDRLIDEVTTNKLELPHPTDNNLQINSTE